MGEERCRCGTDEGSILLGSRLLDGCEPREKGGGVHLGVRLWKRGLMRGRSGRSGSTKGKPFELIGWGNC